MMPAQAFILDVYKETYKCAECEKKTDEARIVISLRKVQMNFWENIRGALLQIAIRYMVILIRASTRPAGLTADENLMTQCLLK